MNYLLENGYIEFSIVLLAILILWYILNKRITPRIIDATEQKLNTKTLAYYFNSIFLLLILIAFLSITENDLELFSTNEDKDLKLSQALFVFLIIQIILFANYFITKLLLDRKREVISSREDDLINSSNGTRSLKYVLIVIALRALIHILDFNYLLYASDDFSIRLNDLLKILLIVLLANFISFLFIKIVLFRYYNRQEVNPGAQYSINQLVRYIIYAVFALLAIESIGISLKLVWGGLAALLVGIGFGLQNVFSDLVAGIILLFERSIEVGDTVELNEGIGLVKKISLRTSEVELRDSRIIVVPNSNIIDSAFINWDKNQKLTRFRVQVGVAYGSDVDQVREVLIQVAKNNAYVIDRPAPFVRFIDFGESSLVFELLFWSQVLITIEDVKSDLRFDIYKSLAENNIKIPFPQRDLWIKEWPNASDEHSDSD